MRSRIFGSAYPLFLFRGSVDKFCPIASDTGNELKNLGVYCLRVRGEDPEGLERENALIIYLLKYRYIDNCIKMILLLIHHLTCVQTYYTTISSD